MEKSHQIANRFREVVLNGTWIANTNYKDQLSGLDWKIATTSIQSLNSVAVLAQHIHYYVAGLIAAFKTGSLTIKDQFSFDFPPIESQHEWETFLSKFWLDAEEFASITQQFSEIQMEQPFIDEKYGTLQRNIDGLIEHSYYHLGQIVLIKKMVSNHLPQ